MTAATTRLLLVIAGAAGGAGIVWGVAVTDIAGAKKDVGTIDARVTENSTQITMLISAVNHLAELQSAHVVASERVMDAFRTTLRALWDRVQELGSEQVRRGPLVNTNIAENTRRIADLYGLVVESQKQVAVSIERQDVMLSDLDEIKRFLLAKEKEKPK